MRVTSSPGGLTSFGRRLLRLTRLSGRDLGWQHKFNAKFKDMHFYSVVLDITATACVNDDLQICAWFQLERLTAQTEQRANES
jgi:hypothetical protein